MCLKTDLFCSVSVITSLMSKSVQSHLLHWTFLIFFSLGFILTVVSTQTASHSFALATPAVEIQQKKIIDASRAVLLKLSK